MHDIKVGDKVVCVDGRPADNDGKSRMGVFVPIEGEIYTIKSIGEVFNHRYGTVPGVDLSEDWGKHSVAKMYGYMPWRMNRFRPLILNEFKSEQHKVRELEDA